MKNFTTVRKGNFNRPYLSWEPYSFDRKVPLRLYGCKYRVSTPSPSKISFLLATIAKKNVLTDILLISNSVL